MRNIQAIHLTDLEVCLPGIFISVWTSLDKSAKEGGFAEEEDVDIERSARPNREDGAIERVDDLGESVAVERGLR